MTPNQKASLTSTSIHTILGAILEDRPDLSMHDVIYKELRQSDSEFIIEPEDILSRMLKLAFPEESSIPETASLRRLGDCMAGGSKALIGLLTIARETGLYEHRHGTAFAKNHQIDNFTHKGHDFVAKIADMAHHYPTNGVLHLPHEVALIFIGAFHHGTDMDAFRENHVQISGKNAGQVLYSLIKDNPDQAAQQLQTVQDYFDPDKKRFNVETLVRHAVDHGGIKTTGLKPAGTMFKSMAKKGSNSAEAHDYIELGETFIDNFRGKDNSFLGAARKIVKSIFPIG